MRRGLLAFAGLAALAAPRPSAAELALLDNGQVLRVSAWRESGGELLLELAGGGEVRLAARRVRSLQPDEIAAEPEPVAEPAAAAAAAAATSGSPELTRMARAAAARHGLDPGLVHAVIAVESAFRPDAVSPRGAQGLMQLMPATAAELGVRDAFDPAQNLDGGVRHLRSLLQRFDGDLSRSLAAYNAGSASVERHGGVPPYRETRAYVAAVLKRYRGGAP